MCLANRKEIYLRSHHVFGRHKVKADTIIDQIDISQLHATIRWNGIHWVILDHSRNGTFIDNKRLAEGKDVEISKDTVIRFGGSEDAKWQIINTSPPTALLVSLEKDAVIPLDRYHVFPNEENPEASVYLAGNMQWIYEKNDQVITLHDADVVEIDSGLWRFCSSNPEMSTADNDKLHEKNGVSGSLPAFIFQVSRDEEHVSITIVNHGEEYSLGERAHHYLLLTLARRRLEDYSNGIDPFSQGWIDMEQLCSLMDLDQCHLNIQIYRARKQILSVAPDIPGLLSAVERRPAGLRFGIPEFTIYIGSTLEGKCESGETGSPHIS